MKEPYQSIGRPEDKVNKDEKARSLIADARTLLSEAEESLSLEGGVWLDSKTMTDTQKTAIAVARVVFAARCADIAHMKLMDVIEWWNLGEIDDIAGGEDA